MPDHLCRYRDQGHADSAVLDHIAALAAEHDMTTAELVQIIAERAEDGQSWPGHGTSKRDAV